MIPIIINAGSLEKEVITLQSKDQDEGLYYQFSLENRVGNQTLKNVFWTASSDDAEISNITIDGQTFKCLISGGTNYHNIAIQFKITTSDAETRIFNCVLPIRPEGIVETSGHNTVIVLDSGGGSGPAGKASYTLDIGTVATLDPDQKATANIVHGPNGEDMLNLGLVQGKQGEPGKSYENNGETDLNVKSINQSAIVSTNSNASVVIGNVVDKTYATAKSIIPSMPIEQIMHRGGVTSVIENNLYNDKLSYQSNQNISLEGDIQPCATDGKYFRWHNNNTE